ncbi:polyketide synthase [Pararhodobacter zhoushanensis]|uniref:beta-ketoacyl [acyl carrier protein] synthase domain-containing protein n=1 Tax=Pararhodobacter zhoushanensis TaxID=2479545 RepID=UPI000F8F4A68|nr:polyketide synthase [Pararhodobacter zhoushanensis]
MSVPVPVAVVGMACRFPGADSTGALAELLRSGGSGIGPVPADRRALWGPSPALPPAAGLLDGIDRFDRHPFRISASEAPLLDPQQRLALEMAWHALEDAGLSPAALEGMFAGVYIGAGSSDHAMRMARAGLVAGNPHLPNALQNAAITGRVSYCLGLTGPSLTVDTACSSALTAVTLAGDALRLGHCDMALAGGVTVLLAPEGFSALESSRVLSARGQTRSFDAAADGFVRSEGCGMLVLKRLPDALADGDRIHAVLAGWATGQDGRSNGLSAPSRVAQVQVITRAMQAAGVTPDQIGAIEAHGSGTVLGDLIETRALGDVFAGRSQAPAALGSIKAAIGHLEAAAGIAGLIKTILMVRDGFIPVQPCFTDPSPQVDWDTLPLEVPRATRDWPGPHRVAGVSGFGMSGLNAHVIVAGADDHSAPVANPEGTSALFLLSAASPAALAARAGQLHAALDAPEASLARIAAAVTRRWSGLPLRAGFTARTVDEAKAAARRIAADPPGRAARLMGKIALETAQPLAPATVAQLRRICPALVDGTPESTGTAPVRVAAPDGTASGDEAASALLALHLAGATLVAQRLAPADPALPTLPGYPFDRQRCWYDDRPAAGKG